MSKSEKVSVLELRRLLYELRDLRLNILVRFRLVGRMWMTNHLRISDVIESGVILKHENENMLVTINDLNDVMQFEIDSPFRDYQPHFHYSIEPYFESEVTYAHTGS
jgi:hypothetical protein